MRGPLPWCAGSFVAVLLAVSVLPGVLAQACGPNNFVTYPQCQIGVYFTSRVSVPSPYGLTSSYSASVANGMSPQTFSAYLLAGSYTFQFNYNTFGISSGSGVAIYYSENSATYANFVGALYDIASTATQFSFNFSVPASDSYSFAMLGFNNAIETELFNIAIVCAANNPNCIPVTSTTWPQLSAKLSSPVSLSGITGFSPMSSIPCSPQSNMLLLPSTVVLNSGVLVSEHDLYTVCYDGTFTLRAYRGVTTYADSWILPSGLTSSIQLIQPSTVNNPGASGLIYLLGYSSQLAASQVYSFRLSSGNFTLLAQLPAAYECYSQAFVSWLGLHTTCYNSTQTSSNPYDVILVTLNGLASSRLTVVTSTNLQYFYTQVTASGAIVSALSGFYTPQLVLTYLPQTNSWSTLTLPIPYSCPNSYGLVMDSALNLYYVQEGGYNSLCVRNASTAYTTFISTPAIATPGTYCPGPIQMSSAGSNPPNLYVQCYYGSFRFQWQPSTSSYLSAVSIGAGTGELQGGSFAVSSDESVLLVTGNIGAIVVSRPSNVIAAVNISAFVAGAPVATNLQLFPVSFTYPQSNYFLYLDSNSATFTSIQIAVQCSAGSTQVSINSAALPGSTACGSSIAVPISTGLTSVQMTYTSLVLYATGSYTATYNYTVTINKSPLAPPSQVVSLPQFINGQDITFVNNSVFFVETYGEIIRYTISDAVPLTQAASTVSSTYITNPPTCSYVYSAAVGANGVVVMFCYPQTGSNWYLVSSLDSGNTWPGALQTSCYYSAYHQLEILNLSNGTTMLYAGCLDSFTNGNGISKYIINATGGIVPIGPVLSFDPTWFTVLPDGDILYSSNAGLSAYIAANGSIVAASLPNSCSTPTDSALVVAPTVKGGNYTVAVACSSGSDYITNPSSADYGSVLLVTGFGSAWSSQVLSTPSVCISPSSVFVDASANLYAVCSGGNSLITWSSSVITAALSQPQKLNTPALSQQAVIVYAGNTDNGDYSFSRGRAFPNSIANGVTWIGLLGSNTYLSTFIMQIGYTPAPTTTAQPPSSTTTTTPTTTIPTPTTTTTTTAAPVTTTPSAGFSISVSPAAITVAPGSVFSLSAALVQQRGASSFSWSAAGLPAGVSGFFSPARVVGTAQSDINLNVAESTAVGTYDIVVTASAATTSVSVPLALTVVAPPAPSVDLSLSAFPTSLSVTPGAVVAFELTAQQAAGQNSPAEYVWQATGLPEGVSGSLSPGTGSGSATTTLELDIDASTQTGTYTITVSTIIVTANFPVKVLPVQLLLQIHQ